MKEKRSLHYLIALAGILAGVCLDQFTKYLAVLHLKGQAPLVLIDGVFQLEYLENRGAAFGLFQGQRLFFFLSAGVILAIVVWFYLRVPMERRYLTLRILAVLIVRQLPFDTRILGIFCITASMPVGGMVGMMAEEYGGNGEGEECNKAIAMTTILSAVTVPLVSLFF